ncbi:FtsW/RodA/SpoVE family cell cycle protein [Lysinibacillus xylanilyticus]|uniref:FtsW/RodA/SpoVE family cell cycle protein n=1 Tax=Lysinibacillus xylanilyticus TaxID=582475 RepID=UPI002B252A81|nr:FtsW/RodA/SpoVE family cell cycle protein [Lysinibacillus xylanilyticus]MEB2278689.1 FtsW/RodA/SpoVE family cell cycle protein [Lysinibacillus xylanilyticus]
MKQYLKRYAQNFDYPLFFTVLLLSLFGLVMIYSSSMMVAIQKGYDPDNYYHKQVINLIVAFLGFLVAAFFPYKHYANKNIMLLLTIVLAILFTWVKVAGNGDVTGVGSKSWIKVPGLGNFQPSEYAKLFIILYFSAAFYRKAQKYTFEKLQPTEIFYPIFLWILVVAGVAFETDLGACIILCGIAVSVVAASGIPFKTFWKFFGVLGAFGVAIIGILWLFKGDLLTGNRKGRILSYFNPFDYESDMGHQVVNSYYAIGGGGLEGRGLGQSIQKLGYLPEPQTDFIMAIIMEELGIWGVLIVLVGLGYIVYKGFSIALRTKDPLARMITAGIASWIGWQTFINLGGVTGLIPLTGVTLPFISYGGTSIIILSLAMGILINVSMFEKVERRKTQS